MCLAEVSGQSFAEMAGLPPGEGWHPRDVDTLWQIYEERVEEKQEQERDARFAEMTAELRQRMGR